MNEMIFSILMILASIAMFCLGYMFGSKHVHEWRVRWIELEYDFARLQGRKPRDISTVENQPIKKKDPNDRRVR